MLSGLNSFGGVSAADILMLFGVNSSSASPSGSTSKSTSPSSSTGVSGSSASDPGNAIKAILAQAQIARVHAVQADPQAQVEQSQASIWSTASSTIVNAQAAYADQALEEAPLKTTAVVAGLVTGEVNAEDAPSAVSYSTSNNFTSASSGSASIDTFEANVTIGSKSLTVGFALEGLGQLTVDPTTGDLSAGNGNLRDFFQIMVGADGQGVGIAFNVGGLDATQAQQLASAFEDATSAAGTVDPTSNGAGIAVDTGYSYDGDYGPDFSVNYSMIVGY
jgi:Tfp pilus assembly protein FimT